MINDFDQPYSYLEKYIMSNGSELPQDYKLYYHGGPREGYCVLCGEMHHKWGAIMSPISYSVDGKSSLPFYTCKECSDVIEYKLTSDWYAAQEELAGGIDPFYFATIVEGNILPYIFDNELPEYVEEHYQNAHTHNPKAGECIFCNHDLRLRYNSRKYYGLTNSYDILPIVEHDCDKVLSPVSSCVVCSQVIDEITKISIEDGTAIFNFGEKGVKEVCYNCKSRYPVSLEEYKTRNDTPELERNEYLCAHCVSDRWGAPRIVPYTCSMCYETFARDNLHASSYRVFKCKCQQKSNLPKDQEMVEEYQIEGTTLRLIISSTVCRNANQERLLFTVYDQQHQEDFQIGSVYEKCPDRGGCCCCKPDEKEEYLLDFITQAVYKYVRETKRNDSS